MCVAVPGAPGPVAVRGGQLPRRRAVDTDDGSGWSESALSVLRAAWDVLILPS